MLFRSLAERKIHLVYAGGSLGLMGSVSTVAFLGGNQVLGVIPKALAKGDIIGKTIREELQVPTMSDRMYTMFNHVDAFIALPGGLGTLEEREREILVGFHIDDMIAFSFSRL